MSLPEVLLWLELRARPDGLKFRRQHGAGGFVLDFYCHSARLCVEVDGIAHDMGDNPERDAERDAWLVMQEIRVLRLPVRLILKDIDAAISAVVAATKSSP